MCLVVDGRRLHIGQSGDLEISRKLRWFSQPYEKFLGDQEIIFTPASPCGLKVLIHSPPPPPAFFVLRI